MSETRRGRRQGALSKLFVESSRTRRAFERMDELIENGWEEHFCRALLLLGPSRAGKTRIVNRFRTERSRPVEEGGKGWKIITVEVPSNCTLKSFATDVLTVLGDPDPEYGSEPDKTRRIAELVEKMEVDLIVIDEVQRLIDADTDKVKRTVANWLTAILNKRVCPLLLVGEKTAERVFDGSMHLQGRTLGQVPVDAYDWAEETDQKEFRAFLHMVEGQLGLPEKSGLATVDTALRIYAFSEGLLGQAVTLIGQAKTIAARKGRPCISHEILAQAVDELRIGRARSVMNPFRVASVKAVVPAGKAEPELEAPRKRRGRPKAVEQAA
ncbi:MAG: TniB family NTP-binding protein [Acetobacteraceae bacterium]|nr:TniB family NTP-binding protein [Acetobacteraceae bacterium]